MIEAEAEEISRVESEESAELKTSIHSKATKDDVSAFDNSLKEGVENGGSALCESEEPFKGEIPFDDMAENGTPPPMQVVNCPKEGVANEGSTLIESDEPLNVTIPIDSSVDVGFPAPKKDANCSKDEVASEESGSYVQSEKPTSVEVGNLAPRRVADSPEEGAHTKSEESLIPEIPNDSKMVEVGIPVPEIAANCSKEEVLSGESTHKSEEPPQVEILIDAKAVADGISALKNVVNFPKEGEESTSPLYSDESATIYLQFTPKKLPQAGFLRTIRLPHPLSYKQDVVCVISQGTEQEKEKIARLEPIFKDIGLKGNIEVISLDLLKATVSNKEDDGLKKFVELYDSCFIESSVIKICKRLLQSEMAEQGKIFHFWRLTNMEKTDWFSDEVLKESVVTSLHKCGVFGYSSLEAYVLKVGNTGFTDSQLQNNILVALEIMNSWRSIFPKGFKHFHSIHLKTGVSQGIPLYINDGEVEEIVSQASIKKSAGKIEQHNLKRKSDEEPLVENSQITETGNDVNGEEAVTKNASRKRRMRNKKRNVAGKSLQDKLPLPQEAQKQSPNESLKTDGKSEMNTIIPLQEIQDTSLIGSTPAVNLLEAVAQILSGKKRRPNRKRKLNVGTPLNSTPRATVQEIQNQCLNDSTPSSTLDANGKPVLNILPQQEIQHPSLSGATPLVNLLEAGTHNSVNKKGRRNRKRKPTRKLPVDTLPLTQEAQKQSSIDLTPSVGLVETDGKSLPNTELLPPCVNAMATVSTNLIGTKKKRNRKRKLSEGIPLNTVAESTPQEIQNESVKDPPPFVNILAAVAQTYAGIKKRRIRKRKPNGEPLLTATPPAQGVEHQHSDCSTSLPLVSTLVPSSKGAPLLLKTSLRPEALNNSTSLVNSSPVAPLAVTPNSTSIKKRRLRKRKTINKTTLNTVAPLIPNTEPLLNTTLLHQDLKNSTLKVNSSPVAPVAVTPNSASIKKRRLRKRKTINESTLNTVAPLISKTEPLLNTTLRPQALNNSTPLEKTSVAATSKSDSIKNRRARKRKSNKSTFNTVAPWVPNTEPLSNTTSRPQKIHHRAWNDSIQRTNTSVVSARDSAEKSNSRFEKRTPHREPYTLNMVPYKQPLLSTSLRSGYMQDQTFNNSISFVNTSEAATESLTDRMRRIQNQKPRVDPWLKTVSSNEPVRSSLLRPAYMQNQSLYDSTDIQRRFSEQLRTTPAMPQQKIQEQWSYNTQKRQEQWPKNTLERQVQWPKNTEERQEQWSNNTQERQVQWPKNTEERQEQWSNNTNTPSTSFGDWKRNEDSFSGYFSYN